MSSEYPRVGQPIGEKHPEVFELRLSDYLEPIPAGTLLVEPIDPEDYFITSGDAVRKTWQLIKDIESLVKQVEVLEPSPERESILVQCIKVLEGSRKMKADLEIARGKFIFMETEWECSVLIVIPKNPRIKTNF
jgi:hypothetical protein